MGVDDPLGHAWLAANALVYLHFAYPVVLLLGFLTASMAHSISTAPKATATLDPRSAHGPGGRSLPQPSKRPPSEQRGVLVKDFSPAKKAVFGWTTVAVAATLLVDAALISVHALVDKDGWWCGESVVVYVVGTFVVYLLIILSLVESVPSPNWSHACTWTTSLLLELAILASHLSTYSDGVRNLVHDRSWSTPPKTDATPEWDILEVAVKLFRIFCLLLLLSLWFVFTLRRSAASGPDGEGCAEECTGLLNGYATSNGKTYGAVPNVKDIEAPENPKKDGWVRPDKMPERGWYEYIRSYSLFFPYLWPSRSTKLKLTVVVCFFLVVLTRLANALVPAQSGRLVNELTSKDGEPVKIPWGSIFVYILLRTLQGNNGLLGSLRSFLWIPVGQYSYRELATAAFEHVHGLSLDFHLNKKTGEVISALNKGGSINNFLETITFNLVPMIVDMVVAVVYFIFAYDAYYALTLFVMVIGYMLVTIRMTQTRVHQRRAMANLDREEQAVKNDSLMSYETVKYFNAEDREFTRYRDAVKAYQKAEYKVYFSLQALNVSQIGIFMVGLLVTCLIAAYQVATGGRSVGSFVGLITYMWQLQSPLNFFGSFYRSIQSSMINAERLLELFKQQPTVVDEPDAQEMRECRGEIQCNEVEFAYDQRHPALRGVSFRCAPGTSTALVGESGGGKSTMFRLLFRFYNLNGGNIEIDGHDVRDITVDSLRRHIGVVPQDTILFNESIMYNLKYANPDATAEQVFDACRAACIHDKILSFPDGYESKVGERGLKLSGGEKQRIAIARTIIKDPRIILLDEATAALDTDTEDHIQEAFSNLQEHRTTLIIAHRLSTITKCDQILVLNGGKIVEAGTHHELVERGGRYASLWKKQMKANKFDLEISRLTDKARRLRENSGDESPSASQSEDERGGGSGYSEGRQTPDSIARSSVHGHKRQGSSLATSAKGVHDEDASSM